MKFWKSSLIVICAVFAFFFFLDSVLFYLGSQGLLNATYPNCTAYCQELNYASGHYEGNCGEDCSQQCYCTSHNLRCDYDGFVVSNCVNQSVIIDVPSDYDKMLVIPYGTALVDSYCHCNTGGRL